MDSTLDISIYHFWNTYQNGTENQQPGLKRATNSVLKFKSTSCSFLTLLGMRV